jgi:SAM-dependent methyltransferase
MRLGEWALLQCGGCGVVYLNPSPTEKELRGLYTQAYFTEHQLQSSHAREKVENEIASRLGVARQLAGEVGPPSRWLDVGCASGYLIAAGQRLGHEVAGVEISEWAAAFATQELGLEVFHGTLEEFARDWDGRDFNLITAMAYIEHSSTPLEDLRTMGKLVGPGGRVVLRVPNVKSLDRHWHGGLWRGWSLPYHMYHFHPGPLLRLAERAGLTPYQLDLGFWNPLVHLREALRGDGLRADHPLEGRPGIDDSTGHLGVAGMASQASWKAIVKSLLGRALTGRDMILYARK